MSTFWILVAVMIVIGLAFVVPTLLRPPRVREPDLALRTEQNVAIARERLAELEADHAAGALDDASFEQAKRELEVNLADDLVEAQPQSTSGGNRALLLALTVALPAATVGLYQHLGAPQHLQVSGPGGSASAGNPHAEQGETPSVEELVARLERRLAEEPNNPDGWYMLGRTKMSLGQYEQAAAAYEQTLELVGEHPSILIALADSIAMTQSGRLSGRPAELVQRALAVSPDDVTALWLAGQAAEEQGDAAKALEYWRKAEPGLQDQPQLLSELRGMIAAVERDSGIVSQAASAEPPAGASLELDVSLAPELAQQVEPGDTVFIFARAEQGPPMPVAAAKLRAGDLPARVTLDDSMAMMPQMKLSLFDRVKVGARISRSGQPVAQSGDLESEDRVVDVAADVKLQLRIDREVP